MNARVAAVAVVVGLAIAACGSDDGADRAAGSTARSSSAAESGGGTTSSGATTTGRAAQAKRGVRLVRIGGFDTPVYVTAPPGDSRRLMVVEQRGRIMVLRGGRKLATPFLDIRSQVTYGGEQGLLSVAFPPDYQSSGRFYVYYTSGGTNRIVEYRRASADRANASTARVVLTMPNLEPNHNGGLMVFGPDRLMYVGTGDGGGATTSTAARATRRASGRFSASCCASTRPRPARGRTRSRRRTRSSAGRARAARSTATGCATRGGSRSTAAPATSRSATSARTRSRRSTSRAAGGRGARTSAGGRGGRRRNFNEPAPGAVFPVIQHTHAAGFCSITGGYIVRDPNVPSLNGRYVYSDFCDGRIRAARLRTGRVAQGRPLALPKIGQISIVRPGRQRPGLRRVAGRLGLPVRGAAMRRRAASVTALATAVAFAAAGATAGRSRRPARRAPAIAPG